MPPSLVLTTHGILTQAKWQKPLAELLGDNNIRFRQFDFGVYNLRKFISSRSNDAMVERFYSWYQDQVQKNVGIVDINDYQKRPSIIAHSFGTFLVGYALLKYEDLKFDKVILCGCILPRDFDWWSIFDKDQVQKLRNEYGVKDIWTKLVRYFVADTGDSGAVGFDVFDSNLIVQQRFDHFRHSDFFSIQHIQAHWLPFLAAEPSNFFVIHGGEMTRKDLVSFLETTGKIDEDCFAGLPGITEAEVTLDLGGDWIDINQDIYTFLVDRRTRRPVGYINAMPLTDEAFGKVKRGELIDNNVLPDDILSFQPNSHLNLYLMSIAVSREVREASKGLYSEGVEKLLFGLCAKLRGYFVYKKCRVDEIAADGWTPQGRKLCGLLGMTDTGVKDPFDHPIYSADLRQPLPRKTFPCIEALGALYKGSEPPSTSASSFRSGKYEY